MFFPIVVQQTKLPVLQRGGRNHPALRGCHMIALCAAGSSAKECGLGGTRWHFNLPEVENRNK